MFRWIAEPPLHLGPRICRFPLLAFGQSFLELSRIQAAAIEVDERSGTFLVRCMLVGHGAKPWFWGNYVTLRSEKRFMAGT
jgi:hypothetical protein